MKAYPFDWQEFHSWKSSLAESQKEYAVMLDKYNDKYNQHLFSQLKNWDGYNVSSIFGRKI